MSGYLMTSYEPQRLTRSGRQLARMAILILLLAFILALLGYALLAYGVGFFLVGWYAWVSIGAFGVVELILLLQRNRFGVGPDWVSPTYKPLSHLLQGRFVVHAGDIASMEFAGLPESNSEASSGFAPYVQTRIRLKSGKVIRFPSHSSRRSLRRQVGTEAEVLKALQALEDFAKERDLLRT